MMWGPDFSAAVDDPLTQNLVTSCVISHGLLYFGEACFRGQVKPNPVLLLHHVLFFLLPIMTFLSRSVITSKARARGWPIPQPNPNTTSSASCCPS